MSGYVRQATANIQSGKVIYAEDINAELNALSAAFSGSTGHIHDGSTGNGPKIELSSSVVGTLPLSNGGTGATNATGARTNIGANNASNLTAGTLPAARLSGNYSFGNLTLSGTLTADGTVSVGGNLRVGGAFIRGEGDTLYIAPNTGDASGRQVIIRPRGYSNDTSQIVFSSNGYIEIPNGGVTASGTFTGNGSGLTNLNASNVSSGTLNANRIPNLNASKVTAGTFHLDRIPALPASKITSGTFAADRIPSLDASILGSGTVPEARLSGNYSFGSLTLSGTLTAKTARLDADSATILRVIRNNNTVNATVAYSTTNGTFYAGAANGAVFAIGSSSNLSDVSNRWMAVSSSGATVYGTITGDGSGLTNLNASNISSGTLPAARLPNHSADLLTSGTLSNARLSGNYSFGSLTLSGNLNLTSGRISGDAANIQTNPGGWALRTEDNDADYILSVQSAGGVERFKVIHGAPLLQGDTAGWSVDGAFTAQTINSGNYSGDGSGLTNLNGSNVSSGTVAAARIDNLPASKITSGTFNADRIPNLSASILTSGTLPNGRLSGNYSFGSLTLSGDLSVSGTISGNGSGLTNLNAGRLTSGTVPAARLNGNYGFDSLTLSGGLSTNAIRVGADSFHVISRNTTNSWLELEGGNGGSSSSRILLYGPGNSDGRGDLRHGDTVRLRWGNSTVAADNGAGGLYTVATVYPGSDGDNTDLPIGHVIWGIGRSSVDRNASATVRVSSDNTHEYDIAGGTGTVLSGTWRSRGRYNGGNVMQRTA